MHSRMGEHIEMDEAAQVCFSQALDDAELPDDPRLRATLQDYFYWATTTMSSDPHSADDVAADLSVARWSWDGPL
jgi:hemoglobin